MGDSFKDFAYCNRLFGCLGDCYFCIVVFLDYEVSGYELGASEGRA
jgi:hypothetical protein